MQDVAFFRSGMMTVVEEEADAVSGDIEQDRQYARQYEPKRDVGMKERLDVHVEVKDDISDGKNDQGEDEQDGAALIAQRHESDRIEGRHDKGKQNGEQPQQQTGVPVPGVR